MLLGESYEKQGAFGEAAAAYEQAIKLNPKLLSATIKAGPTECRPLASQRQGTRICQEGERACPKRSEGCSAFWETPRIRLAILGGLTIFSRKVPASSLTTRNSSRSCLGSLQLGRSRAKRSKRCSASCCGPGFQRVERRQTVPGDDGRRQGGARPRPRRKSEIEQSPQRRIRTTSQPSMAQRWHPSSDAAKSKAAATLYTEVLRRFRDFAPAQKRLAALYLETPEKREEAYDLAVKAREALPDDPELAQTLAELSYDRKEFAYAVQLLRQSAEKRPLDAKYLYYLGMSHLRAKEKTQSRQALDQALAAGLQDPLASDARRAINELDQE